MMRSRQSWTGAWRSSGWRRRIDGREGSSASLFRRDQPLEPRIALEWREIRVDAKPRGREIVIHLQQRLELIHRLFRVPRQGIHARELMLDIGADVVVV